MKFSTGVALGVLALIAGSGIAAPQALAEDVPAETTGVEETAWHRNVEARLGEDAQTIADDAMAAASKIDLSARLDPADADEYRILALANER